jgi:hypothetical protein
MLVTVDWQVIMIKQHHNEMTPILLIMIKIYIFSSLLLAATVLGLRTDSVYRKVIHNTDPEARCLDGSPSLLYVHEGGDPKNILIFFLGGGMCG